MEIRLEDSSAIFDGDHWSTTLPELYIFDSRFVHENVYSGEVVEHEQKRNLFRVIVGERGVSLARKVDSLDVDVREADKVMRMAKLAVAELAPPNISADDYVSLEVDPHVDAKIKAKDAELVALRRFEEIAVKELLTRIEIPTLRNDVSAFGNERAQLRTQQALQSNVELTEFWKQFVSFEPPEFELGEFLSAISELRTHAVSTVDSKAAALLEPAMLGTDFGEASDRTCAQSER